MLHVGLPQEMTVQVRDLLPLADSQALPRPPRDRAVVPWQVSGPGCSHVGTGAAIARPPTGSAFCTGCSGVSGRSPRPGSGSTAL